MAGRRRLSPRAGITITSGSIPGRAKGANRRLRGRPGSIISPSSTRRGPPWPMRCAACWPRASRSTGPATTASARPSTSATRTTTASNSIGTGPKRCGRARRMARSRCSRGGSTWRGCCRRRRRPGHGRFRPRGPGRGIWVSPTGSTTFVSGGTLPAHLFLALPAEGAIMFRKSKPDEIESSVRIPTGGVTLEGNLGLPATARGVVLFAHGSGSGRHSPRNRFVAERLRAAGLGTLLIDLLTEDEERIDDVTAHLRFDIGFLAARLVGAIDWLQRDPQTARLPVGLFGASTGGGAALVAAAKRPERVGAVVSRGGRPDLAGEFLALVRAPTLLIVGGHDDVVITLNR